MSNVRSWLENWQRGTRLPVWLLVGAGFAVALATGLVVIIGANFGAPAGILAVAALCMVVWLTLPRRTHTAPKLLVLLLLAMTFSTLLHPTIGLLVQTIALAAGFVAWIAQPLDQRRGSTPVFLAAIIIVFWSVLILHPNVPGAEVGLLGLRKTTMCVAGFALGASVAVALRWVVERLVVKVVLAAVVVSIFIHLFAPGLEASITRGAGEYTAIFGGQARLQGIFSGPFHIAVAGILLVTWAVVRFSRARTLASIALVIGIAAIALSLVRTAFVAIAVALVVVALVAPSVGKATKRLAIIAGLGIAALAIASVLAPQALRVLGSIAGFQSDTRFLGRFAGYEEGLHLVSESPLIGWGAGSAGDTLDRAFVNGEHITSHNVILKIAVEGGLVGLILWIAFIVFVLRATRPLSSERTLVAGLLAGLVAMGMTVASTETLPISYLLFVIAGLCARASGPDVSTDQEIQMDGLRATARRRDALARDRTKERVRP